MPVLFLGENCHRGGALGALLAAHAANTGKEIPMVYKDGLNSSKESMIKISQCLQISSL